MEFIVDMCILTPRVENVSSSEPHGFCTMKTCHLVIVAKHLEIFKKNIPGLHAHEVLTDCHHPI